MREGLRVEFTRQYADKIVNTAIAFANGEGGTIYIGLEDDGRVCGVDNADGIMNRVSNVLRDSVKPDITVLTTVDCREMDGKQVVVVEVQKGLNSPYFLGNKGMVSAGVFVR